MKACFGDNLVFGLVAGSVADDSAIKGDDLNMFIVLHADDSSESKLLRTPARTYLCAQFVPQRCP